MSCVLTVSDSARSFCGNSYGSQGPRNGCGSLNSDGFPRLCGNGYTNCGGQNAVYEVPTGPANNPDPVSADTSGTMLVQFTSGGSVTRDGFHATMTCGEGSICTTAGLVGGRGGSYVFGTGDAVCSWPPFTFESAPPPPPPPPPPPQTGPCDANPYFEVSDGSLIYSQSGGGDYANNLICKWTVVCPEPTTPVVTFTSFDTERNFDYVDVFEGTTATPANRIAELHGTGTQVSTSDLTQRSSVSTMLVQLTTDGSVVRSGFVASIACEPAVPPPPSPPSPCDTCMRCASGKFSASPGATTCEPCLPGLRSDIGAQACEGCPAGTFESNATGVPSCLSCSPGTYTDIGGESQCTACPAGLFSEDGASSSAACFNCSSFGTEACIGCLLPGGVCRAAADYPSETREDCALSIGSWYADYSPYPCNRCPAGRFDHDASPVTECQNCIEGYISVEPGMFNCSPCPAGTSAPPDSTVCYPCQPGTFAADVPVSCFCSVTLTVAVVVYGGEMRWSFDGGEVHSYGVHDEGIVHTEELPLPNPGDIHTLEVSDTYGDGWHGGYWMLTDGCGKIIGGGESEGQVAGYGGTFDFAGGTCTPDQPTVRRCTACGKGTYANSTGAEQCTPCSIGTYGVGRRAQSLDTCVPCSAGKYDSDNDASSECVDCPAGKISDVKSLECSTCEAGRSTALSDYTQKAGLACGLCHPDARGLRFEAFQRSHGQWPFRSGAPTLQSLQPARSQFEEIWARMTPTVLHEVLPVPVEATGGAGRLWHRAGAEMTCMADLSEIEDAIGHPYLIQWDANAAGEIANGGNNMYNTGNRISTSLCPQLDQRLRPYTADMVEVQSDCFGAGGSYMMDLRPSMMVLVTQNTDALQMSIQISGSLGANGGGLRETTSFTFGRLTGYMSSVCGAETPSVNHLFIIDGQLSPDVRRHLESGTDEDDDGVSGIGPGSPLIYMLYSSEAASGCLGTNLHEAIFQAAVAALSPDFCPSDPAIWFPLGHDFHAAIPAFEEENGYLMRWSGGLLIPSDGDYTFETESGDGSMLYIDGQPVVINDGIHDMQAATGTIFLRSRMPHSIVITFFEDGGSSGITVRWTPAPDADLRRLDIKHVLPAVATICNCECVPCMNALVDLDSDASTPCTDCPAGDYPTWTREINLTAPRTTCSTCDVGTHLCNHCEPGRADLDHNATTACSDCPSGQFSGGHGSSTCENCPAGRISTSGADTCIHCQAGQFVGTSGSCEACPVGKYSSAAASTDCINCAGNIDLPSSGQADRLFTFPGAVSSSDCFRCGIAGTVDSILVPGASCIRCPAGTFDSDNSSSTACVGCVAGKHTPLPGATYCLSCAIGTYAAANSSTCSVCTPGRYDHDANITSAPRPQNINCVDLALDVTFLSDSGTSVLVGGAEVSTCGLSVDGDGAHARVANFDYSSDGDYAFGFWMSKDQGCTNGAWEYVYAHNTYSSIGSQDNPGINMFLKCTETEHILTTLIVSDTGTMLSWDYPVFEVVPGEDALLHTWAHVIASLTPTSAKMFVDGTAVSAQSCSSWIGPGRWGMANIVYTQSFLSMEPLAVHYAGSTMATDIHIGARFESETHHFLGTIAGVRISRTSLCADAALDWFLVGESALAASNCYNPASTPCRDCPVGTSSPQYSSLECTDCVPGDYAAPGSDMCTHCPLGQFSSADHDQCYVDHSAPFEWVEMTNGTNITTHDWVVGGAGSSAWYDIQLPGDTCIDWYGVCEPAISVGQNGLVGFSAAAELASSAARCGTEITVVISIAINGYPEQIRWNLDGAANHTYIGTTGISGDNGRTFTYQELISNPTDPHVFNFYDTAGDGWHGGWFMIRDSCGNTIAGQGADGYVQGFGGSALISGYVSGTGYTATASARPMPTQTSSVGPVVAVLWTDFDFTLGGSVAFEVRSEHVVITWTDVPHRNYPENPSTFQAVLEYSGDIRLQYLRTDNVVYVGDEVQTMGRPLRYVSTGFQDRSESLGQGFAFGHMMPDPQSAVQISSACHMAAAVAGDPCIGCARGRYSDVLGSDESGCRACLLGKNSLQGAPSCYILPCEIGTVNEYHDDGSIECKTCPTGEYSWYRGTNDPSGTCTSAMPCVTLGWQNMLGDVCSGSKIMNFMGANMGEYTVQEHHDESFCYGGDWQPTTGFKFARDLCFAANARLCTMGELMSGAGRGSGCSHEIDMTWSSSPCGVGFWAVQGDGLGEPQCMEPTMENLAITCCADRFSSLVNHCDSYGELAVESSGVCEDEDNADDCEDDCEDDADRELTKNGLSCYRAWASLGGDEGGCDRNVDELIPTLGLINEYNTSMQQVCPITCSSCATYKSTPPSGCRRCPSGTYQPDTGSSICPPCHHGTWDHDSDATTPCQTCVRSQTTFLHSSCKKIGCTDPAADNYDPEADVGSADCIYSCGGLTSFLNSTKAVDECIIHDRQDGWDFGASPNDFVLREDTWKSLWTGEYLTYPIIKIPDGQHFVIQGRHLEYEAGLRSDPCGCPLGFGWDPSQNICVAGAHTTLAMTTECRQSTAFGWLNDDMFAGAPFNGFDAPGRSEISAAFNGFKADPNTLQSPIEMCTPAFWQACAEQYQGPECLICMNGLAESGDHQYKTSGQQREATSGLFGLQRAAGLTRVTCPPMPAVDIDHYSKGTLRYTCHRRLTRNQGGAAVKVEFSEVAIDHGFFDSCLSSDARGEANAASILEQRQAAMAARIGKHSHILALHGALGCFTNQIECDACRTTPVSYIFITPVCFGVACRSRQVQNNRRRASRCRLILHVSVHT